MKDFLYTLPIGTILHSPKRNYIVESVLGQGGFGITYKVSAEIMDGNIPIKSYFCLKEHFLQDVCTRAGDGQVQVLKSQEDTFKDSLNDFKAEAKRLNALSGKHKGLVRVNEVFAANNTSYYVMEYLNGESIRAKVKRDGKYTEEDALLLIKEIGDAVAYLHSQKVTHLDIKPDNIMLHTYNQDELPYPVLIDFGLAKHYDKTGKPTAKNSSQGCSCGYSPMEQYVRIDSFSPVSDVYALAATLLYMLTGKDPVISSDMSAKYIKDNLPSYVEENTINTLISALKRNKDERIQTIDEFLDALQKGERKMSNENTKINLTKMIGSTRLVQLKWWHYTFAVLVFFAIGNISVILFNKLLCLEEKDEIAQIEEKTLSVKEVSQVDDVDMQTADALSSQRKENDKKTELQSYLQKAELNCEKAEKQSGSKATIQIILDAKYFYYDRAKSLYKELYNKNIGRNERIDKLVAREYNYWIEKGNSIGKNKKNYAQKKEYYENAYKLVESDRIKSYIDWLDRQLNDK